MHEPTAAVTTRADLTSPGSAVGTVAYMSPEQVRGEMVDARTDLFSFGAVLYEMATARRQQARLRRQSESRGVRAESRPPELARIIDKCLEKDRALRYQHAAEMRTDLQRLKRDRDSGRRASADRASESDASALERRRRGCRGVALR